jgi:hypothetical protein
MCRNDNGGRDMSRATGRLWSVGPCWAAKSKQKVTCTKSERRRRKYFACVCKYLGYESRSPLKREGMAEVKSSPEPSQLIFPPAAQPDISKRSTWQTNWISPSESEGCLLPNIYPRTSRDRGPIRSG